jgi:hypothetical protein
MCILCSEQQLCSSSLIILSLLLDLSRKRIRNDDQNPFIDVIITRIFDLLNSTVIMVAGTYGKNHVILLHMVVQKLQSGSRLNIQDHKLGISSHLLSHILWHLLLISPKDHPRVHRSVTQISPLNG